MNDKLIQQAVSFLKHPQVQSSDKEKQIMFLKKKGLSDEEVAEAYKRLESKEEAPAPVSKTGIVPFRPLPNTFTINQSYANLTQLPSLASFTSIKVLIVSHNQLTAFPKEISTLVSLKVLNAGYNEITHEGLPAEFFELINLKQLHLNNNKLSSLDRFESLYNLELLNLGHNSISDLPDKFILLQKLQYLYLHSNPISRISPKLSLLSSLRQLVILPQVLLNADKLPKELKEVEKRGLVALKDIKLDLL